MELAHAAVAATAAVAVAVVAVAAASGRPLSSPYPAKKHPSSLYLVAGFLSLPVPAASVFLA
jgi:hypothetical protein